MIAIAANVGDSGRESWTIALIVAAQLFACSSPQETTPPDALGQSDGSIDAFLSVLRPESDLTPNCFNSPEEPFGPDNSTSDSIALLAQAQVGIDFTLSDVDGAPWTLSLALRASPVILITGSYTCPIYRDRAMPGIEALAQEYQGRVQLVHLYTVEAHPQDPEPSAYRGEPWPLKYSDVSDPKTYAERVENARALVAAQPAVTAHDQILLIDDLSPRSRNNPFWCSWATCANCGFLVDQQGQLALVQDWFEVEQMRASVAALLDSD